MGLWKVAGWERIGYPHHKDWLFETTRWATISTFCVPRMVNRCRCRHIFFFLVYPQCFGVIYFLETIRWKRQCWGLIEGTESHGGNSCCPWRISLRWVAQLPQGWSKGWTGWNWYPAKTMTSPSYLLFSNSLAFPAPTISTPITAILDYIRNLPFWVIPLTRNGPLTGT